MGVHVHQHVVGGGSLAAMIRYGMAIIDVGVLADVELRILAGFQPDLKIALRVDQLDADYSQQVRDGRTPRLG